MVETVIKGNWYVERVRVLFEITDRFYLFYPRFYYNSLGSRSNYESRFLHILGEINVVHFLNSDAFDIPREFTTHRDEIRVWCILFLKNELSEWIIKLRAYLANFWSSDVHSLSNLCEPKFSGFTGNGTFDQKFFHEKPCLKKIFDLWVDFV